MAALAAVVAALGWLQYRWIDEVARAQETRTKSRLLEEAESVSDSLDTEITRAALFFTLPPDPGSALLAALEQRWRRWNRDARWARLVSGVALLEPEGTGWRARWLGDSGSFDPRWVPASERADEAAPAGAPAALGGHIEVRAPDLFLHGKPFLVQPVPAMDPRWPPRIAWLAMHYDLDYAAGVMLPRFVETYVGAEDRADFRFSIGPKAPAGSDVAAAVEPFHFRPDCLMPDQAGGPSFSATGFSRAMTVRVRAQHSRTLSTHFAVAGRQPPDLLLQQAGQCRMPASHGGGPVQLSVIHQGSLRDVYSGFRRRNEILSGLVLLTLLVALTALVAWTARARRLAQWQTAIAAGISHELRTPLASLILAADDLRSGHAATATEAVHYGEIVDSQARRLRHIVDQALCLTTVSQWNCAVCLRAVRVPEVVDAAMEALRPMLTDAGMEVEKSIAADLPLVLADPDLVQHGLANLIENAVKYAGSGGSILISARAGRHGGRRVVELAVEDHGPGIHKEEAAAVFEPFYRGESGRRSRQPGSGLGLAIVKSAMEAHGGWVKLERAIPHGCKFRMLFPAGEFDS